MIRWRKRGKKRPPVKGALFFVACIFGVLYLFELMIGASRTALWLTAIPALMALTAAVCMKR